MTNVLLALDPYQGETLFGSDALQEAIASATNELAKHDVHMFVSRLEGGKPASVFSVLKPAMGSEVVSPQKSFDVVLNRSHHDAFGAPLINDRRTVDLMEDKDKTYELLAKWMPESRLVSSSEELRAYLAQTQDARIVAKPVHGVQGVGVVIDTPLAIAEQANVMEFPLQLQTFVDTSCGIDGLVEGVHDIRFVVIGSELQYAMIRTPAEGSLLSNTSQGGQKTFVALGDVPKQLVEVAAEIAGELSEYQPAVYSIDLVQAQDRPYLIELNHNPRFNPVRLAPSILEPYYRSLADYCTLIAKEHA